MPGTQKRAVRQYDVTVQNHGSIVLVTPETEAAREWVEENVPLESWQWWGGGFACEPRYLGDLVAGMRGDGLTVRAE